MDKLFKDRNSTDTAKRKIKNLAKNSNVPVEIVTILANFTRDYDPQYGNEAYGWVSNENLDEDNLQELNTLAEYLGLPENFSLSQDQAAEDVIALFEKIDPDQLWLDFMQVFETKNYTALSPFSSYYHLQGLTRENIHEIYLKATEINLLDICNYLFLKIFRGGDMERNNLAYVWCDLNLNLVKTKTKATTNAPALFNDLINNLVNLNENAKLNDLIACCKGCVAGDKDFKREVLQALSCAGILKVNGIAVGEVFLPTLRDKLSPHFNANECRVPLRFWSANGGYVDRTNIPKNIL